MDLRTYLQENELDAATFAAKIPVTKEAVLLWLAGARMPRPEMMQRIVDKTDGRVTPNDFLRARREPMRSAS